MSSLSEAWLKEKETLESYKKKNPELFEIPSLSEKELLSHIGIDISLPPRSKGYIRLYPQDFIVEEISKEGSISQVELKAGDISPSFPFHLGCDLVKVGISTFDALNLLANMLQIKLGRITYAGLKDLDALTSQRVVFLDLNEEIFRRIKNISIANLFLTNFSIEKKKLIRGDLFGNRFSLFIRTKEKLEKEIFSRQIEEINKNGFLNFYSVQRFGTPRFLSHILGKLILKGEYEKTILNFFSNPGIQEIPLIAKKRKEAKKYFGNWEKIEQIFSEFPFVFRNELLLLSFLKENPKDFIGALDFFKEQTKFWSYSYASYLFNQILSLKGLELPEEIPLLLSDDPRDWRIYDFWLKKHGTQDFKKNIKPFRKFLILKRRFVKTRVFPQNVSFKIFPPGVALSFILEKGVYATTFLMYFFEAEANLFGIKTGLPLPEWLKRKKYDVKAVLGLGSINDAKKIFKKALYSSQE